MDEPAIFDKKPVAVRLKPGNYYWCACGRSSNQPFCDGSHKVTTLVPLKFTMDEEKEVWLCQCKHSGNKPFCDGTHKKL